MIDYKIDKLDHYEITLSVHGVGMIRDYFTSEQKCWSYIKKHAKESRWAVNYWMSAPAPPDCKFHRSMGNGSYWPEVKLSVEEFKRGRLIKNGSV